ncbi:MAG TPA: AmmeMemoRadiSam system radical SAM enzyme [Bacteroidales bacterium]|nr:AmmeMemoRadiSam system radical SAM enzyme [Bacteroidales bacterium]
MISLQNQVGEKLECLLCPHKCKLTPGMTGVCGVRKNRGEKIELLTYGVLSGYSLDPVEKKPLYHFFPGYNILSIGSYGCNMKCDFCQNYNISQKIPEKLISDTTPEKIINAAISYERNIGIAFTYNEPIIWYEYMSDVATAAKNVGLFTVMVSNGYINSNPLDEIIQFIDAFNIDLKAFNDDFYRKLSGADIEPVKNGLKQIAKSGKHLEITTLIIPGKNDDTKEMEFQSKWIAGELGKNVPLHLSRYFPMFRRDDPATSQETLIRLFEIASKNLDHVYMGNTSSEMGQTTYCPHCGTTVTIRSGYKIRLQNIDKEGRCTTCGHLVYRYITISS